MQTLYRYSGNDIAGCRRAYEEVVRPEYFDGDFEADPAERYDLTFEKALAHPISLLRVRSSSGIAFRRSLHHIRANALSVRVLWFVRSGTLQIARSRQSCEVKAGECAIVDSNVPFHARAIADAGDKFDAVQAIVPAHLFFSHLPMATGFDSPFEVGSGNRQIITKLLALLFGEGAHLSRSAAESLVAAFLETISDTVGVLGNGPTRQKVMDKRFADIEAYICKRLTDPDLCYDEVAEKCRISRRYLCYLLKANQTSFSDLLWGQRLTKARDWLAAEAMLSYPVFEIAFMAGFKSASHFSRMFKSAYGCPPKEYRAKVGLDSAGEKTSALNRPTLTGAWAPQPARYDRRYAESQKVGV